jgi:hypothetical protein
VPKNSTNSSNSAYVRSSLLSAAHTWVSIGVMAPAAPTQESVMNRRSRAVSTPRRHISPNTNPMTPVSM